jgi:hypothetical protein
MAKNNLYSIGKNIIANGMTFCDKPVNELSKEELDYFNDPLHNPVPELVINFKAGIK